MKKSFIVYGEDTRTYKNQLKEMGGKFNGKLKAVEGFEGGAGWIFPTDKLASIEEFMNKVEKFVQNNPEMPNVIVVSKYDSSSFIKF